MIQSLARLALNIGLVGSLSLLGITPSTAFSNNRPILKIVDQIQGVWTRPPRDVPSGAMPGGPILGNGDLGVVLGGKPEDLQFYLGKSDFFGVIRGGMMPVGSIQLSIPALSGSTYLMKQKIGLATVSGKFKNRSGADLGFNSWVVAKENLLVIQLKNRGMVPLQITSRLLDGFGTKGNSATFRSLANGSSLSVSPDSVECDLGNRMHGGSSGSFVGSIADVVVSRKPIAGDSKHGSYFNWMAFQPCVLIGDAKLDMSQPHGGAAVFTGNSSSAVNLGVMRIPQSSFAVSAWVNPSSISGKQFIFSAQSNPYAPRGYPFYRGFSLFLDNGALSARLNTTVVSAASTLPTGKWTHVYAYYNGKCLTLKADGVSVASTSSFPTTSDVMGWDQSALHFGDRALPYAGCGPRGIVVQQVHGVPVNENAQELNYTIAPGREVEISVAVETDRNSPRWKRVATELADENQSSRSSLEKQHIEWWNRFWSKSSIEIPDKKVEDAWYDSLYLLACCSSPKCPPPGLWGNFITQRQMGWQGDYTLDYNMEAPFWAAYATNHLELADNYETSLLDYIARGKAIAEHYHQHGMMFYTHLIPPPGWDDDPSKFMGQKSGLLFGCVDCLMRWRYTHSWHYMHKVYPLLHGCAEFWDHYLVLQNGRYVDLNDGASEGAYHDTNTATTLAFLHLLYTTLQEVGSRMGASSGEVSNWRNILDKLSPLPIVQAASVDHVRGYAPHETLLQILGAKRVDGRSVIRDSEAGSGYPAPMIGLNHNIMRSSSPGMNSLQVVYPGWDIGIESSLAEQQAAYNTALLDAQWDDYNNDCTFYPSAAAAGIKAETILAHLDSLITFHSSPNLAFQAGGGTENFAIVPCTLSMMFLQSYQKDIHLFPNWPLSQNAKFSNLNACGGFLISSEIRSGKVVFVKITSSAGQMCRILNPWKSKKVVVQTGSGHKSIVSGSLITLSTKKGEEITLTPA